MGMCKFCGSNAGFLRGEHSECRTKYDTGVEYLVQAYNSMAMGMEDSAAMDTYLERVMVDARIGEDVQREALVRGWRSAVDDALSDHLLTEDERQNLDTYRDRFSLSDSEMDGDGHMTKMAHAGILQDARMGIYHVTQDEKLRTGFNFQKSEELVWLFPNSEYYEERVRRERQGGHGGVSVRVARGVYYNTGRFNSRTVETTVTEHMDTGTVGITTKHIYFGGKSKKFRVNYSRIMAFDPFTDGIGIMREAQTARPQKFKTGHGWFIYNLVTMLANE